MRKISLRLLHRKESNLAEPVVAVVDKVVDKKGTRQVAEDYVPYLYSPEGQTIVAQNFFRPRDPAVLKKFSATFKPLHLFTADEKFGGWQQAQKEHFGEGGSYDQRMKPL